MNTQLIKYKTYILHFSVIAIKEYETEQCSVCRMGKFAKNKICPTKKKVAYAVCRKAI